jgi:hypothetical protein
LLGKLKHYIGKSGLDDSLSEPIRDEVLWGEWNHAGPARGKISKIKQWEDGENEETQEEGQTTNNKLKKMSRDSRLMMVRGRRDWICWSRKAP